METPSPFAKLLTKQLLQRRESIAQMERKIALITKRLLSKSQDETFAVQTNISKTALAVRVLLFGISPLKQILMLTCLTTSGMPILIQLSVEIEFLKHRTIATKIPLLPVAFLMHHSVPISKMTITMSLLTSMEKSP